MGAKWEEVGTAGTEPKGEEAVLFALFMMDASQSRPLDLCRALENLLSPVALRRFPFCSARPSLALVFPAYLSAIDSTTSSTLHTASGKHR
ncbi:hypothetical protein ABZX99_18685 [Streptomyces antibioticus]|uniref:hypothetical protein n=1 Tax=Streptomyces antibioticus TaxID=1890 RepID=UPI0033A9618F